eukprot:11222125-Lingulodinium_polyedra.AAC.1
MTQQTWVLLGRGATGAPVGRACSRHLPRANRLGLESAWNPPNAPSGSNDGGLRDRPRPNATGG